MKLDITYTLASERQRIRFTIDKLDFYAKKKHLINMPKGISILGSSDDEVFAAADREFPSDLILNAKTNLQSAWRQHREKILNYLDSLPYKKPREVKVILTQYGGGGSYNVNTSEIIINVKYGVDLLSILVHEMTHLVVDSELVHKFSLDHEAKESLIKWLISSSELLAGFIKVPTREPVEPPGEIVLRELEQLGYSRT